ncbi:transposable element Tcb2 transposase [Trichonephila clavipes]|nr:transposable element Tcb2 transposase [Trichonephila clavipes]
MFPGLREKDPQSEGVEVEQLRGGQSFNFFTDMTQVTWCPRSPFFLPTHYPVTMVLGPVDPRNVIYVRPGSGLPLKTSRREDHHIVRNPRVQPTASSAAIQAQVAASLGAPVSSQTIRSDKSRFNLSSDEYRARVWRPRGEILNPAFALQQHTRPTAGVMEWGAIAYNTRSSMVLIHGT